MFMFKLKASSSPRRPGCRLSGSCHDVVRGSCAGLHTQRCMHRSKRRTKDLVANHGLRENEKGPTPHLLFFVAQIR